MQPTVEEVQTAITRDNVVMMKDIYFRATGKQYQGGCGSCAAKFLKRFCLGYLTQLKNE